MLLWHFLKRLIQVRICTRKWGDKDIPEVVSWAMSLLNGSWDSHVQKAIVGKKT